MKNGPLKTQVLASLYRLPPAGRFFEKWTPKNTSFGVVVQVASGGFIFFKTETLFLHGSPGGGEQVPPAVLFFQNRHLFYTSPGGVVQVASGGSIF